MRIKLEYSTTGIDSLISTNKGHHKIKTFIIGKRALIFIISILTLMAGCASIDSRISNDQATFNSWPGDVQKKIRAGQVEIGFTREMTRMALGDPQRIITLTTDSDVTETWVYEEKKSNVSLGLGLGTMRNGSALGGGVTMGEKWKDREVLRVTFDSTKVTVLEQRK